MYYYIYMIVDIFSRCIVGWEIHENWKGRENGPIVSSIGTTRSTVTAH